MSDKPLRIAVVQQPMAWATLENVAQIVTALALAAGQGVRIAGEHVDLVFRPSLVGNPPGTVHPTQADTDDLGNFKRAALMAQRLGAFVVQSNWLMGLNTPASTHLGESKAYAPDGEILLTLPRDQAGVGVFVLAERNDHWTPLPA